MPNALLPELNGRRLTVDVALKNPSNILRNQIAKLVDEQLLLPRFFHPLGAPVEGGGIIYSVVQASDFYTSGNVESVAPGDEFPVVEGVDPEPKLAAVDKWGGKFSITDEQVRRNAVSYLDQQTTQLSNTITRKLDNAAYTALDHAITAENTVPLSGGTNWENLVFVGPEDTLTPSSQRPTAHLSAAQMAADLQELGVKHDLLVVHPTQAHELRSAYAENLDAMLKSAGVTMFSNPHVEEGIAWAVVAGQVGNVGFEMPLTVETYDDRDHQQTWVQAYCIPALAVDKPYCAKKIVLG